MRNNDNASQKVKSGWFIELKEKYPSLWYYERKNSKSNGKGRNVSIDKIKGNYV